MKALPIKTFTNFSTIRQLNIVVKRISCRLKNVWKKQEKNKGFGFVSVQEFFSSHWLNGVEFHGKPILIEEARLQATQSLKYWSTCNNYSDVFKQRKKDIMFFSNSIPKNLKMKDFNATVTGESAHLKGCLRCKTVTSQNVSSEAQVKNFFYFVEIFVP